MELSECDPRFEIGPSTISGAGSGLFAKIALIWLTSAVDTGAGPRSDHGEKTIRKSRFISASVP